MKENRKKRKTPTMNRGLWFKMGLLFILITFFMPVVNASSKYKDLTPNEKKEHKERLLAEYMKKPQETSVKRKKTEMVIMKQNDEEVFDCDVCNKPCKNREAKKTGCEKDHKGHKKCIDIWHKEDHVKKTCPVCNRHVVTTRSKKDNEHCLKFHASERIGTCGLVTAVPFFIFDMLFWTSVIPTTYEIHYLVFLFVHWATVLFSSFIVGLLNLAMEAPKGTTILHLGWNRAYERGKCGGIMVGCCLVGSTSLIGLIYDKLIPGNGMWTKLGWVTAFFAHALLLSVLWYVKPFIGVYGEGGEFVDYLREMYRF